MAATKPFRTPGTHWLAEAGPSAGYKHFDIASNFVECDFWHDVQVSWGCWALRQSDATATFKIRLERHDVSGWDTIAEYTIDAVTKPKFYWETRTLDLSGYDACRITLECGAGTGWCKFWNVMFGQGNILPGFLVEKGDFQKGDIYNVRRIAIGTEDGDYSPAPADALACYGTGRFKNDLHVEGILYLYASMGIQNAGYLVLGKGGPPETGKILDAVGDAVIHGALNQYDALGNTMVDLHLLETSSPCLECEGEALFNSDISSDTDEVAIKAAKKLRAKGTFKCDGDADFLGKLNINGNRIVTPDGLEHAWDSVDKKWFHYDETNGVWLSDDVIQLSATYMGTATSGQKYLGFHHAYYNFSNSDRGYPVPRDLQLDSVTLRNDVEVTQGSLQLCIIYSHSPTEWNYIYTKSFSSGQGFNDPTASNGDSGCLYAPAGDIIRMWINISGGATLDDPSVLTFWRIRKSTLSE